MQGPRRLAFAFGLVCVIAMIAGCGLRSPFGSRAPAERPAEDRRLLTCEAPPATEAPTMVVQEGHTKQITSAVLSHDGQRLATSGMDGTVRIWDTRTGLLLRKLAAHPAITRADLSGDGTMLAYSGVTSAAGGFQVAIADLPLGKVVHSLQAASFALSPDGRAIAVPVPSGVELVDPRTGRTLRRVSSPPSFLPPSAMAFDAEGTKLAIAYADQVIVASARTGRIKRRFAREGSGISVGKLVFSGSSLLAVTRGYPLEWYDTATGKARKLGAGFDDAATTPRHIWAVTTGSKLKTWDAATGEPVSLLEPGAPIERVAASADGRTLVLVSRHWQFGSAMHVLDGRTLEIVRTIEGRNTAAGALALAPSGETLAVRGSDSSLASWDLTEGVMRSRRVVGMGSHFLPGIPLAFDGTGKFVATTETNTMVVVEAATGRIGRRWSGHEPHATTFAAFRPQLGLLTAGRDGRVMRWEIGGTQVPRTKPRAGSELARPRGRLVGETGSPIVGAALSPDGSRGVGASRKSPNTSRRATHGVCWRSVARVTRRVTSSTSSSSCIQPSPLLSVRWLP